VSFNDVTRKCISYRIW